MNRIFLQRLHENLSGWMGKLAFWVCLLLGIWNASIAFHSVDTITRIFALILSVFFGLCTGILFVFVYLPGLSARFADFLIYPKQFLKEAPYSLSRAQGFLASGDFQSAETELLTLQLKHPEDPGIARFLFEVYTGSGRTAEAFSIAESFFRNPVLPRSVSPENMKLLMRYSDLAIRTGKTEGMTEILSKELGLKIYSVPEKSGISARIVAFRKKQEEDGIR